MITHKVCFNGASPDQLIKVVDFIELINTPVDLWCLSQASFFLYYETMCYLCSLCVTNP